MKRGQEKEERRAGALTAVQIVRPPSWFLKCKVFMGCQNISKELMAWLVL